MKDALKITGTKPKTSRLAATSFVLSLLTLLFGIFTAIPAIIFGLISLRKIKNSGNQLKGRNFAIAGIVISLVTVLILTLFFSLLSLDADPLIIDYTIADLRSAPAEYAESYDLLKSLGDKKNMGISGAPSIGLSEQDVKLISEIHLTFKDSDSQKTSETLRANADKIRQIWDRCQKGRDVIGKLGAFDEIADLADPKMNLSVERECVGNLVTLHYVYDTYVRLQTISGNHQDAIRELVKFDSVFRKLSINSRDFLMKYLCYIFLKKDIRSAAFIVNHPDISEESLQRLVGHFIPLTDEQVALRNPILFQSLETKKVWMEQVIQNRRMQYRVAFKPNSFLRLKRNFWIEQLEIVGESRSTDKPVTVWPHTYPDWLPDPIGSNPRNVPWCYTLYNIAGSMIFQASTPLFSKRYEVKTEVRVLDDLLQIALQIRLGKEVNLKAIAYSNEYIIDTDKKEVISPGPDEKLYTEDDIKLPICVLKNHGMAG